jgi:integrase
MTINQLLNSAMGDGLLYRNVCFDITLPTYRAAKRSSVSVLINEGIENAELSDKERAFIEIGRTCGLRRGEMLALTISDVDTKNKKLIINKAVTFDGNEPIIKDTKTKAGVRKVPIPTKTNELLKIYIKSLPNMNLFEKADGGLMTKRSYLSFWYIICKKINLAMGGNKSIDALGKFGAHDLRHDYCSMLYYAGVPAKEAQSLLGHSDVMTTLNIYTHLDENKESAASKIDEYLA